VIRSIAVSSVILITVGGFGLKEFRQRGVGLLLTDFDSPLDQFRPMKLTQFWRATLSLSRLALIFLRRVRNKTEGGAAISAGLKPRPSGNQPRPSNEMRNPA